MFQSVLSRLRSRRRTALPECPGAASASNGLADTDRGLRWCHITRLLSSLQYSTPVILLAQPLVQRGYYLGCARRRMNTSLPGGRPQMTSLVPFRKRLVWTFKANQFVVIRLVLNSGFTVQVFVPVEVRTM